MAPAGPRFARPFADGFCSVHQLPGVCSQERGQTDRWALTRGEKSHERLRRAVLTERLTPTGSPRASTSAQPKTDDVSNLKLMPKGLSASLPDLDSESWIEVKKRPRPSPARPKVRTAGCQTLGHFGIDGLDSKNRFVILFGFFT